MSRGNRQQRRREARRVIKEHRLAETEVRMAESESLLETADRRASDMPAPSGKIDPNEPAIYRRLRKYLRDTGIIGPYEGLLRDHPGIPSPLEVEALVLSGLMNSWRKFSYLRTDGLSCLLKLSSNAKDELGMRTKKGKRGLKYRTYHKQMSRLEEAIIAQEDNGGPFGMAWLAQQMLSASVPKDFLLTVEALSVDESSFGAWHEAECNRKQSEVDYEVRKIFRKLYPNQEVPEMSAPVMRNIAFIYLEVSLGEDGRIQRTQKDPTVRRGRKTPTSKSPSEFYDGWGVTTVVASGSFTLSRNSDKATLDESVRQYVLATSTNPANTNPGPVGCELIEQALEMAPNVKHVYADQAYTQKESSFLVPLRRRGLELHMGLPDTVHEPNLIKLKHKDGSKEPVIEFCGNFYHQYTPVGKFAGPYEELAPYAWRVHESGDEGAKRLRCAFCAGHVYNRRFASSKNAKPNAEHVMVPKNAKRCCKGDVTVPAEDLGKFQIPAFGSKAHSKLRGARNPAEGKFGNVKDECGFDPKLCRTKHTVTHGLASLFVQVVRNLRMTLDDEIEELRAARKAKQTRKAETAVRKAEQDPSDGSPRSELDGQDSDDEASDEDDESSSEVVAPSRAPP